MIAGRLFSSDGARTLWLAFIATVIMAAIVAAVIVSHELRRDLWH